MPNIYNGICYPTIQDAAKIEISNPVFNVSSGLVSYTSFTQSSASTGTLFFNYKLMSTNAPVNYSIVRTYPLCASLGPMTTTTMMSVDDAVTVSFLVVLVWVVAYYFKMLRTGVRGY